MADVKRDARPLRFQRIVKIRHLLLIQALSGELNFRRAADVLRTSPSAVSRSLTEIEELLGERLFERSTRRMSPTDFGRSLIWHAERILNDLDLAEADFLALSRGVTQSLHVGLLWGFAPHLLGRAVALFHGKLPRVEVRFHEGFAGDLFRELTQDRVEMILSHVDVPRRKSGFDVKTLYDEEIALVVRTDHPLARRKACTIPELAKWQWVLPPSGTTLRTALEREFLETTDDRLPPIVECIGPHFAVAILESSNGIAAMPASVADWMRRLGKGLVRLRVKDPLPKWPVCVAQRRGRRKSVAEDEFLRCLGVVVPSSG